MLGKNKDLIIEELQKENAELKQQISNKTLNRENVEKIVEKYIGYNDYEDCYWRDIATCDVEDFINDICNLIISKDGIIKILNAYKTDLINAKNVIPCESFESIANEIIGE